MRLRILYQNHKKEILFLVLLLMFTLSYSYADRKFQNDSETLVTGVMLADRHDIYPKVYGMGRYADIMGSYTNYTKKKAVTEIGVQDGYMVSDCGIVVEENAYTNMIYQKAAKIKFPQGQILSIKDKVKSGKHYWFYLDNDDVLGEKQAGKINDICFIDAEGDVLPVGLLGEYSSQYGLPGKVFAAISHSIPDEMFNFNKCRVFFNILCGFISAFVFIGIGYYVGIKYNNWLLAIAFWLTFMASTWVRDFAINLYWVEFTWFIPMFIGLYCSVRGNKWQIRWLCYFAAFFALLIKCLSGYEYVSTIMIALVMFPMVDAVAAWSRKEYSLSKKASCMVVSLGIMGLLGFCTAFSMHAYERGQGDIIAGVESIYHRDVLRRTWAGDAKGEFADVYQDSFNAGLLDMVKIYCLLWERDVLWGIPGRLFPVISLIPLIIYLRCKKRRQKLPFSDEVMLLYAVSFVATFSWYALAKSHSYIHIRMNYVLWYFGFVQICVYVLLMYLRKYIVSHRIEIVRMVDRFLSAM